MGEWTRERHEESKRVRVIYPGDHEDMLAEIERWQSIAGQMKRHAADALNKLAKGQTKGAASALFDACALLPQPTDADLPLVEDFEPAVSEERAREVAFDAFLTACGYTQRPIERVSMSWAIDLGKARKALDAALSAARGQLGAGKHSCRSREGVDPESCAFVTPAVEEAQEKARLYIRGIAKGHDCDNDAHSHETVCYVCEAEALTEMLDIAAAEPAARGELGASDRSAFERAAKAATAAAAGEGLRRVLDKMGIPPAKLTREEAEKALMALSPTAVRHLDQARTWLSAYAASVYRDDTRDRMAAILRAYVAHLDAQPVAVPLNLAALVPLEGGERMG